ncbi:phosphatidate cytidylyltransferase [Anaerobacillus alkalidiazotrophicus]|uniref:Phosphatidate cytidylyltransferase n=1 Tax=Anaerobacillus alkalidiazotrophicus TaxID=472963 RepID=A0A1S2LZH0_9BACI|nr:phosphatidate cytidylyltransferase [Anaerobacillus alkalidiazotrophicus]OIJ17868.1 phosphatidate cytidylyltransferase [Anaerobacillus alkalidiazotrophicus]
MKERIITGVIAGLAFILLIIIGGLPFTLFIMLLASIAMIELLRMKHISPFSIMGILSLLFMWVLLIPNQWIEPYISHINRTELFLAFIIIFLAITVISKNCFTFDEVGFVIISSVYVGFGFRFLIETRLAELGLWLVFFVLFLIWATDSGAYFFGRAIGKRKLWPDISPKKTIEGSIGGIGCALAVGLIFNLLVPIFDSLFTVVLISIVVSIVGQLGDLVESALKRHYSVKDSGNVLPGHGGILDRFDSLIFVMPVLYLFHFI